MLVNYLFNIGWVWLGLGGFGWVWVSFGSDWVGLAGFGWVWVSLARFGWEHGLEQPIYCLFSHIIFGDRNEFQDKQNSHKTKVLPRYLLRKRMKAREKVAANV